MIFVTVGTHEQPFNRLLACVDELKKNGTITDEVIMQSGYSTYVPSACRCQKLFAREEMEQLVSEARIVITHGGPASFLLPLSMGKIPIVVPRQKRFGEHVNDHQAVFTKAVAERDNNLLIVTDIAMLGDTIADYDILTEKMAKGSLSHTEEFCRRFEAIVKDLMDS